MKRTGLPGDGGFTSDSLSTLAPLHQYFGFECAATKDDMYMERARALESPERARQSVSSSP